MQTEGDGTVFCDGGPCRDTYDYGSEVTLTAEPGAEMVFSHWEGCAPTDAPKSPPSSMARSASRRSTSSRGRCPQGQDGVGKGTVSVGEGSDCSGDGCRFPIGSEVVDYDPYGYELSWDNNPAGPRVRPAR